MDPRPRYPAINENRKLRLQFPATWRREVLNARTVAEDRRDEKADEWVRHAHAHGTLHPRDYTTKEVL
jgi:hypothetical protein